MSVVFRPTKADLLAASRLHHLSAICRWRVLALICGLCVAYGVFVDVVLRPTPDAALWGSIMALLAATIKEQHALHGDCTLTWSEQGYGVRIHTGSSEMSWTHYLQWREDGRVILLYSTSQAYQFVPKRVLPAGAEDFFRIRLRAAGVPHARRLFS